MTGVEDYDVEIGQEKCQSDQLEIENQQRIQTERKTILQLETRLIAKRQELEQLVKILFVRNRWADNLEIFTFILGGSRSKSRQSCKPNRCHFRNHFFCHWYSCSTSNNGAQ